MGRHKGTMAIALLDILGFRSLMAEMEPEELYEATLGEFDTMIERSTGGPQWTNQPLRSVAFSDTLFLWLEPNRLEGGSLDGFAAVQDMCIVVSGLVARGMRRHIPLRGAIAYGECFVSEDPIAFIGKPIIDAYELEQNQQWAGAALCTNAAEQLGDFGNMAREPFRPVVRYPVPLKQGRTASLVAVKWPLAYDVPHPTVAMRPPSIGAPEQTRHDVQAKISNTTAFYEAFLGPQPYVDQDGSLVLARLVVPSRR